MRNRKQLSVLTAVIAMTVITAFPGLNVTAAENDGEITVQILTTSDLHGKFAPYDYAVNEDSFSGSLAQISTAVKELRTDNTILVDVGDTIQGNSADLFLEDEIHPMIQGMNFMDYDVWVPGNHEFNYGVDVLKHVAEKSDAAVLTGNVYNPDGSPLFDDYTIIEKDGVKIGIIGMVSPNITRWDAAHMEGYDVTNPVEETQKAIDEIKDQVDVIIAAEHMAEGNEYEVEGSGVIDLANACPDIDVILAAHGHTLVEGEEVNGVLIIENQDSGRTLSQINLSLEQDAEGKYQIKDKEAASIKIADYEADEEFLKETADADAAAKEDANTVIGTLTGGPLAPEAEITGVAQAKLQESSLLNLINEVQMHYADADVAVAAFFNDAANMQNGDIRKCDLAMVYKYANTLYKLQMNGKQLKSYMEWSASYYNTYKDGDLTVSFNPEIPGYNYDIFSGVNYEVNVSKEPGSRIENLTWPDGTEVKDEDTLTIAVNNYRASSQLLTYGEIYQEGEELPVLLETDVRGELGGVRELIGEYIVKEKNGTLEAPALTGNWKITGNDWNQELHEKAAELINSGKLELPNEGDAYTANSRAITEADIAELK